MKIFYCMQSPIVHLWQKSNSSEPTGDQQKIANLLKNNKHFRVIILQTQAAQRVVFLDQDEMASLFQSNSKKIEHQPITKPGTFWRSVSQMASSFTQSKSEKVNGTSQSQRTKLRAIYLSIHNIPIHVLLNYFFWYFLQGYRKAGRQFRNSSIGPSRGPWMRKSFGMQEVSLLRGG